MEHPHRNRIDTAHWRHANNFFTKLCRTITISPEYPPRYYTEKAAHVADPGYKFEYTQTEVYNMMSCIQQSMDGTDYILIPEFSEAGRLHFHGVFRMKTRNQIDNFVKVNAPLMTRRIGQTKIDGVPHPAWIQYMFKDYEQTEMDLWIMALEPHSYIPFDPLKDILDGWLADEDLLEHR
jgi:hypothetical protein